MYLRYSKLDELTKSVVNIGLEPSDNFIFHVRRLMSNYANQEIFQKVLFNMIWVGQTEAALKDAFGKPLTGERSESEPLALWKYPLVENKNTER